MKQNVILVSPDKSVYYLSRVEYPLIPKFWVPRIFDCSFIKKEGVKDCEQLLNEKTIEILKTHKPKPLSEDLVKELKKMEETWFKQVGLEHAYPKRKYD